MNKTFYWPLMHEAITREDREVLIEYLQQDNPRLTNGPKVEEFEDVWNPFFDDQFFDGKTFDFSFDDKTTYDDPNVPDNVKGYFNLGDTVILKLSKLDRSAYEFFEKKYNQLFNAGNPFSTPTNVPTNIKGGALGVWVGYSPAYDTLVCIP